MLRLTQPVSVVVTVTRKVSEIAVLAERQSLIRGSTFYVIQL